MRSGPPFNNSGPRPSGPGGPGGFNRNNNRYGRGPQRPQRAHRINEEINVPEVRIVQDEDESLNNAILPIEKALRLAEQREEDLVEIAAQAVPPVCRIIEYSKLLYELKKKEKDAKQKQHITELKEIRFGPNTDDHDFEFKARHAEKFLNEGNKIKAYVTFHGRTIIHKSRGEELLNRFVEVLEPIAKLEAPPRMDGKRMVIILAPKK